MIRSGGKSADRHKYIFDGLAKMSKSTGSVNNFNKVEAAVTYFCLTTVLGQSQFMTLKPQLTAFRVRLEYSKPH